jgi:succinate dehydrogenase / fumarate reductase cytochrome b subunit
MAGAGGPYPAGLTTDTDAGRAPAPLPEGCSVPAGTLYRGREGMWSWVAHRVTGVLIFFFLFAHVLDTALVRVSPQAYNSTIATYKTWPVNLMEYGLTAAILFHALNGLRVIAVDFWAKGPKYQRQMLWTVVTVWVVLMAGAFYPILQETLRNWFG